MEFDKIYNALQKNNYTVSIFKDAQSAVTYLNNKIDKQVVGFGDSQTLQSLKLAHALQTHNTVLDPYLSTNNDEFIDISLACLSSDIYITSVNAISETGVIINIDGTGNRVAGSLFGHKKVYFVVGKNKIAPTIEEAIYRARNIAAPQNAKRLHLKTPCAINGDKCFDCSSPDRICNGMIIHYKKMRNIDMEVILIDDILGY